MVLKKDVERVGMKKADKKRLAEISHKEKKWLNDGIFNDYMAEAHPKYNKTIPERVIQGKNNQFIIIGRDRPRGPASGYGGAGHSHAACIDIIAGMGGPLAREEDPETGVMVTTDKDPFLDSARIYISQRADIDKYFKLPEGVVGNEPAKSAVAVKADGVRIIARDGIKLVTGTDTYDSRGVRIGIQSGIDLIAGNSDEDLQPLVKGNNLCHALADLSKLVNEVSDNVGFISRTMIAFCSALAAHFHISSPTGGPTAPDFIICAPACASAAGAFGFAAGKALMTSKNTVGWNFTYVDPDDGIPGIQKVKKGARGFGAKYILSVHNNTN